MPQVSFLGNLPLPQGAPARIAVDYSGRVYVTSPLSHEVLIYSNNGVLLKRLQGFQRPLSIAVDLMERLYVGDEALGSVSVYDRDGTLFYYLGAGEGEFSLPNDIAVGSQNRIYVTDSKVNEVRVYSYGGAFLFAFGSAILNFPTGITTEDSTGEVFVSDHNNKRVAVFTGDGLFLREIDAGGGWFGSGDFLRPQGIALDPGRLYIVDSYNSTSAVYNRDGNFQGYLGNYGAGDGEFRIPMDAAFDRFGKLFVTNTNNQRIEVLGIDSFISMDIAPDEVDFTVSGNDTSNAELQINSPSPVQWTASISVPWLQLSQITGTTPSTVTLTLLPKRLAPGKHTTEVSFITPEGLLAVVKVTVNAVRGRKHPCKGHKWRGDSRDCWNREPHPRNRGHK